MAAAGRARPGCIQAAGAACAPRRPGRLGAPRRPGLWLLAPAARHPLPAAGQRGCRLRPRAPRPRPPRPRAALEAALGPAAAAAAAGGARRGLPRPAAFDTEPRTQDLELEPGGLELQGRSWKQQREESSTSTVRPSASQSDAAEPLTSLACASTEEA